MANETLADIIRFPFRPGNPRDPNLSVVSQALRASRPEASDADCRTMTRELALAFERSEQETRGMTAQQKSEYSIIQLRELLIELHLKSGMSLREAENKTYEKVLEIAEKIEKHRKELNPAVK